MDDYYTYAESTGAMPAWLRHAAHPDGEEAFNRWLDGTSGAQPAWATVALGANSLAGRLTTQGTWAPRYLYVPKVLNRATLGAVVISDDPNALAVSRQGPAPADPIPVATPDTVLCPDVFALSVSTDDIANLVEWSARGDNTTKYSDRDDESIETWGPHHWARHDLVHIEVTGSHLGPGMLWRSDAAYTLEPLRFRLSNLADVQRWTIIKPGGWTERHYHYGAQGHSAAAWVYPADREVWCEWHDGDALPGIGLRLLHASAAHTVTPAAWTVSTEWEVVEALRYDPAQSGWVGMNPDDNTVLYDDPR